MESEILNFQIVPGGPNLIKTATRARVFFVDSNGGGSGTSGGLTPEAAFTTIDAAIGACTASRGDIIYVMAGHAESISGAAAIAADVAGISIIGLGNKTNRPVITLHTTDATIAVSAANITFQNLVIKTDVDAVVKIFNVTAAGLTLDGVDFIETTSCAALQFLLTSTGGTDLTIRNCHHSQTGTAATALSQWIVINGATRANIHDNFFHIKGFATSNPANGIIVGATTLSSMIRILRNICISTNSTGAVPISLFANSTGFVADNRVASAKTAIAGSVGCAGCYASNNYAGHVVNTSGLLDPVVDA